MNPKLEESFRGGGGRRYLVLSKSIAKSNVWHVDNPRFVVCSSRSSSNACCETSLVTESHPEKAESKGYIINR